MIFEDLELVLDPVPHGASFNMAMDEVLLNQCQSPTLRFYRWGVPAVSFGFFGAYHEVECCWPGREAVRRCTGGGIVSHAEGEDVTYTLVVPRHDRFVRQPAVETYARIHDLIARALSETIVAVELAANTRPKSSNLCFENPAPFDVVASGQKIAGAAQRRSRHGLLHQGSIRFDQPPDELRERIAALLGKHHRPRAATREEIHAAEQLASEKYGTPAWLRRR